MFKKMQISARSGSTLAFGLVAAAMMTTPAHAAVKFTLGPGPDDICLVESFSPGVAGAIRGHSKFDAVLNYMLQNCPDLALTLTDTATGTISTTPTNSSDDIVPDDGTGSTDTDTGDTGGGDTGGGDTGGGDTGGGDTGGGDTGGGDTGGGDTGGGSRGNNGGGNGSEGSSPGRGGGANNDEP